MNEELILSKRLVYSTILAVVIIGGALYLANTSGTPVVANDDSADTESSSYNVNSANSATADDIIASEGDLTKTDILTRNVLQPYLEQTDADAYSSEAKEQIIQNATAEMFALNYVPVTSKDITVINDLSKEGAIKYKQELYEATKPLFELTEYELTIYARAIDNNSKEDFDTLLSTADIYKKAGGAVLAIPAPSDVSAVHLDIINSLYKFALVLQTLAKGYDDPAASLAGTGNFTDAEEEVGQAFTELKTYFILKDIDQVVI